MFSWVHNVNMVHNLTQQYIYQQIFRSIQGWSTNFYWSFRDVWPKVLQEKWSFMILSYQILTIFFPLNNKNLDVCF